VHAGSVRVRPDIVFTRRRVAVFVDGCFWHGCPDHGNVPSSNLEYWVPKLAANAERDRRVNVALEGDGWVVVRIWEHVGVEAAVASVESVLRK
jgi:DNA mismatch endonuclease (patch repair protein)